MHTLLSRLAQPALVVAMVGTLVAGCRQGETADPLATVSVLTSKTRVTIGGPIDFTYRFEVAPGASFDGDYRVFVHISDLEGRLLWTDDHDPPEPTSTWTPGQVIEYTRTQFIPRFASPGDTTVEVGLYRGDLRLPLAGPDEADNRLASRSYRVAGLQVLPESEGIFLVLTNGWHGDEFDENDPSDGWQWTGQRATLSFANPRTDATLFLEYDGRPEVFTDAPQTVTVLVGDTVVDRFEADVPERRLRRILLPADALGAEEMAEVHLEVDRTFVPASLPAVGRDERELGLRVYHVFVERR